MDILTEQLLQQINESHIIVRDSIKQIVHLGSNIVAENFILSQMPLIGYQWFQDQVQTLAKKHYIQNDDFDDDIYEDEEPIQVNIDHWRRCQGQVVLVKSQGQSPIRRSDTKKLTKISLGQTLRDSENYESQLIKMGELDDDLEFDPNIESMRQAKLRQMQIQQQKLQNDKIKSQEVQEQARQLKRLNVDSKSKYTYDFEGKVIVQKPPDIDRYPKSHQNIQEKRNLVEVRDLIPNHKQQSELITSVKRQSAYMNSINQFVTKTYVPQIDIIVMKEGVSFYDGKSEKKKERPQPLIDIKDNNELQNTLLNQNVHMTKQEYQAITNTQQLNNTFQNKTLQLSISQPQIQQSKTSRTFQEDQQQIYNNDSLLSYRQPKTTVNNSITSNILQKLNGSISILSEEQLDGLIISNNDANKLKEHPLFGKKNTIEITKQLQTVPPITLELPQIPPNALSNSVSKLPRSFQSIGTFPKLLSKYPRELNKIQEFILRKAERYSDIFLINTKIFKINYILSKNSLEIRFPCSNNLKVAKIEKIINDQQGLSIQYFYEGFEGEKQDIPIIFEDSYVDEGFKLASSFQSSQLDASNFTRVLFNLIEIFYQSANFGLFFDSYDENLYYYKELDQFVFLPTFSLIVRYLQSPTEQSIKRKFLEFRRKIYQNATYHFLNSFYKQFLNQTKLSEEDSQFFQDNFNQVGNFSINDILNIEESWKGVDYLYREEKFLKRLPRYKFKQSMILYQLQNNQNLQDLFKKSCENETKILEQKSNDSNSMQSTILAQFNNIQSFFREIPIGNESSSFEIFGNFMTIMHDYLKSQNISENKIDLAPYSQLGLIRQTIEFKDQQKNENIFEFTLCNEIEKQKSSNQQQKQYNQYDLKIQYIFQCTQSSIIIKTTINEIQLSIDTADDLIFLINTIIREPSAINIYVDASRKLTLQTSVTMASPLKLFRIAIRIFDILQIYYIMILGFYQQNIQLGRSLKEKQFQQFVKELIHYMSDYEIDFDDQMKKFGLDNENQSGQIK